MTTSTQKVQKKNTKCFKKVKQRMLKDPQPQQDIEEPLCPFIVSIQSQSSQLYGQDIQISTTVTNVSGEEKDLQLVVGAQSVHDYGITRAQFWKQDFYLHLSPGEERSVSSPLSHSLYEGSLLNNNLLRITALLKEPNIQRSHFALSEQDVTVCKPSLVLQMPNIAVQFQPITAMVLFTNPLGESLKECVLRASGKGLLYKERQYWCGDVTPGSQLQYPVTFTPTLVGSRRLCVQLDSRNLKEIIGFQKLDVLPANAQEWTPQHWEEFQKSAERPTISDQPETAASVSVSIKSDNTVLYGHDISVTVRVTNQSDTDKDLLVLLYAQYVHENWNFCPCFWKEERKLDLSAKEERDTNVQILLAQYADFPWESPHVRFTALIKDVTRTFSTSKKVIILKPNLTIQMQGQALQYQPITAKISCKNPLDETLEDCKITASGEGLIYGKRSYRCRDIDPSITEDYAITFTPTHTGSLKFGVRFSCNQFCDAKISRSLEVLPSEVPL